MTWTHTNCPSTETSFQMPRNDHHFNQQRGKLWSFLTHPNTHSLILCDTRPTGSRRGRSYFWPNPPPPPKLDITQRQQSGRAARTWINRRKQNRGREKNYVRCQCSREKTRVARESRLTNASAEEQRANTDAKIEKSKGSAVDSRLF